MYSKVSASDWDEGYKGLVTYRMEVFLRLSSTIKMGIYTANTNNPVFDIIINWNIGNAKYGHPFSIEIICLTN